MKKKQGRKLTLSRETLRRLELPSLRWVAGAAVAEPDTEGCDSAACGGGDTDGWDCESISGCPGGVPCYTGPYTACL